MFYYCRNSIPPTTTVKNLEEKQQAAKRQIHVDVAFWGGLIPDNKVKEVYFTLKSKKMTLIRESLLFAEKNSNCQHIMNPFPDSVSLNALQNLSFNRLIFLKIQDSLIDLVNAGVVGFKCFLCPSGVDEFPHVGEADVSEALKILAGKPTVLAVNI